MNLQRDNYTLRNYTCLIRVISITLIVAFLWQNVTWANPDITSFTHSRQSDTIQVQTSLSDPAHLYRPTIDLVQEIIERSVPEKEALTLEDIKKTLKGLDGWNEENLGNYEWEAVTDKAGTDVEVIITFTDKSANPLASLRYYIQHPDPEFSKHFPSPWKEEKPHVVNSRLHKQIKLAKWDRRKKETPEHAQAELFLREKELLRYRVYRENTLYKARTLYVRFEHEVSSREEKQAPARSMASFSNHEKLIIWQYMILTNLHLKQKDLFKEVDSEITRVQENFEIDGVYIGYTWKGWLKAKDKRDTIDKNIKLKPDQSMLDVGCGKGDVIIGLAKKKPRVFFYGIDANPYNISEAINSLSKLGASAPRNVRFHVRDCREREADSNASLRGIPYKEGTFDVVSLMEGVMDDGRYDSKWNSPLWREAVRVTKKGGGSIAFFGVKGEGDFETSLPKGIAARRKTAPFYIGGKKEWYQYPFWGGNSFAKEKTEFKIWKLGKAIPEPPKLEAPPKQEEKKEEEKLPEQGDLFDSPSENTVPVPQKTKKPASKRSTKYSDLQKAESVYQDYYEFIFEKNLDLFVLMAERKKHTEEGNDLLASGVKSKCKMLLDELAVTAAEFAERLEELPEKYKLSESASSVRSRFTDVKQQIDKDNEPAACAVLVAGLNMLTDARETLVNERFSLSRRRPKVWKEGNEYVVLQHRHYKPDEESKNLLKKPSKTHHKNRWLAARSLDNQTVGCLDERDSMLEMLRMIAGVSEYDLNKNQDMAVRDLDLVFSKVSRSIVEEKRLTKHVISRVKKMVELGYPAYVDQLLPIAERNVKTRVADLEDMLGYIEKGRKGALRAIIGREARSLKSYTDDKNKIRNIHNVSVPMAEGNYGKAFSLARDFLEPAVEPYTVEPELEGLKRIAEALRHRLGELYRLSKDKEANAEKIASTLRKANFWKDLLNEKLDSSEMLGEFMKGFWEEYTSRRMEGNYEGLKEDIFMHTFSDFVKENNLDRGSPDTRAFQFLSYLAVFVSPEKDDPENSQKKIPNPVFQYLDALRLMIEVDDIRKITTIKRFSGFKYALASLKRSFRSGKSIHGISQRKKKELTNALAMDFRLSPDEKEEVDRAFNINRKTMLLYGPSSKGGRDTRGNIRGNAIEPQKMEVASWISIGALLLFLLTSYINFTPFLYALGTSYVIIMGGLPLLTGYFIRDGLSFRHERRDHGLIPAFEEAENIRYIQDHEEEARGKVSYYSYTIEKNLKEGEEIKKALFVDKAALGRIPKAFQYIIYFHELIHFRFRVKVEATAVPLTYCLPWAVAGFVGLVGFFQYLSSFDAMLLMVFTLCNTLMPFIVGTLAAPFTLVSAGGHRTVNRKRHSHLKDEEIDNIISSYVFDKTYDESIDTSSYWRDWLKGDKGHKNFEIIKCHDRPEDIIVIKSAFNVNNEMLFLNLKVKLESSDKRSFVLIIADDGPENGLSQRERRRRVEDITKKTLKIASSINPTVRIVKKDIRSTKYDITRLRDLLKFWRKRLSHIRHHNLERECVACEVTGEIEKLHVLLEWLNKNGYRNVVFMGDYLGKEKNGFEALDVLRDHIESGKNPKVTLLMGRSEHLFLRTMMGDDRFTDTWPYNDVLEGPAVMRSLRNLASKKPDHNMSARLLNDIKEAREFEKLLRDIAKRNNTTFEEEWKKSWRMHPKLLDLMEFMVDNMKFVYHEDKHHNIYLIGSVPEDLERGGLRGIEALRKLETEFCAGANIGLRQLKLMRDIWILMNAREDEDVAKRSENVEKVISRINRERLINKTLHKELFSNGLLGMMESVILEEKPREHLDVIFNDISKKLSENTRPMPQVFDMVYQVTDSPFRPGEKGGMELESVRKKTAKEQEEARQGRRIVLAVNTIITPQDFPGDDKFQTLGWLRAFDKDGNLKLIDVDALIRSEEISETILVGKADDEEVEGMSLESVTKRKLKAVEEIMNDYDVITVSIREKRLWNAVKDIVTSPFFIIGFLIIAGMSLTSGCVPVYRAISKFDGLPWLMSLFGLGVVTSGNSMFEGGVQGHISVLSKRVEDLGLETDSLEPAVIAGDILSLLDEIDSIRMKIEKDSAFSDEDHNSLYVIEERLMHMAEDNEIEFTEDGGFIFRGMTTDGVSDEGEEDEGVSENKIRQKINKVEEGIEDVEELLLKENRPREFGSLHEYYRDIYHEIDSLKEETRTIEGLIARAKTEDTSYYNLAFESAENLKKKLKSLEGKIRSRIKYIKLLKYFLIELDKQADWVDSKTEGNEAYREEFLAKTVDPVVEKIEALIEVFEKEKEPEDVLDNFYLLRLAFIYILSRYPSTHPSFKGFNKKGGRFYRLGEQMKAIKEKAEKEISDTSGTNLAQGSSRVAWVLGIMAASAFCASIVPIVGKHLKGIDPVTRGRFFLYTGYALGAVILGVLSIVVWVKKLDKIKKFFEVDYIPEKDEETAKLLRAVISKWSYKGKAQVDGDITLYESVVEGAGYEPGKLERLVKQASVYVDAIGGIGNACVQALESNPSLRAYNIDPTTWDKVDIAMDDDEWKEFVRTRDLLEEEKRYSFVRDNIYTVNIPEKPDLVTSFFAFRYTEDPVAAFENLYNQLADGGTMFLTVTVPTNGDTEKYYGHVIDLLNSKGYAEAEMRPSRDVDSEDIDLFVMRIKKLKGDEFTSGLRYKGFEEVFGTVSGKKIKVNAPSYDFPESSVVAEQRKMEHIRNLTERVMWERSAEAEEELKDMGYYVFVLAGTSGSEESVYSATESFAKVVGFDKGASIALAISVSNMIRSIEVKDLMTPAVVLLGALPKEEDSGIEVLVRESGEGISGRLIFNQGGFNNVTIESRGEKTVRKQGLVASRSTSGVTEGMWVVARRDFSSRAFSPDEVKSFIKVLEEKGVKEVKVYNSDDIGEYDEEVGMHAEKMPFTEALKMLLRHNIGILTKRTKDGRIIFVHAPNSGGLASGLSDDEKEVAQYPADHIVRNLEEIIPLFVQALRSWTGRAEENEEMVLFLDMPSEQSDKVKSLIEEFVIKPLQRGSGDNAEVKDALSKLRIITRGRDNKGVKKLKMRVLGENPRWKAENVVIMTSKSNLGDFSDIKGAFITALDFSLLDAPQDFEAESYYYPYVEATFFALIRAIGALDLEGGDENSVEVYKERLWEWYRQIPNVEELSRDEFLEKILDNGESPRETVILKLIIPDAVKFDPRDVYEVVKEFIIRA